MPKAKRSPIDYPGSFAPGIFRPKEVVDNELATIEAPTPAPAEVARPVERSNERPFERTTVRPISPIQVRHSFDVRQDQLTALAEIQTQRFQATGRKPKLGQLVQEALDVYITKETKRTNGRTNERSNERTTA